MKFDLACWHVFGFANVLTGKSPFVESMQSYRIFMVRKMLIQLQRHQSIKLFPKNHYKG
jgi:hypothetical protein